MIYKYIIILFIIYCINIYFNYSSIVLLINGFILLIKWLIKLLYSLFKYQLFVITLFYLHDNRIFIVYESNLIGFILSLKSYIVYFIYQILSLL